MGDTMKIDADVMRNICSNLSSMIDQLHPGAPVDEVSGEPPEGSRNPDVVTRGSREIEWRWAKEAIGLTAVELNEAYAEFEIDRDGCNIPSPHLRRASARLLEIMRRLGIADYREIDTPVPF